MTANCKQIMLFPCVGYVRLEEGGAVTKLGWVFCSDDLRHDFFQVW